MKRDEGLARRPEEQNPFACAMSLRNANRLKRHIRQAFGRLLWAALFALPASALVACSEEEGKAEEYADWQARNNRFFQTLQDSLTANPTVWRRYRCYSYDQSQTGTTTQCIYVKVLRSDAEVTQVNDTLGIATTADTPLYTDSVRVAYRGRLLPSLSYSQGFAFDQTYQGSYSRSTTGTSKMLVSSLVDGFTTAVMQMRRGDRWLVYMPYQLAYGETAQTNIPAYSTLVFDIDLFDFSNAGHVMRPYKVRRR